MLRSVKCGEYWTDIVFGTHTLLCSNSPILYVQNHMVGTKDSEVFIINVAAMHPTANVQLFLGERKFRFVRCGSGAEVRTVGRRGLR